MRRTLAKALVLASSAVATGCGGDDRPAPGPPPAVAGRSTILHPELRAPRLLEIDRPGDQTGTSDRVT